MKTSRLIVTAIITTSLAAVAYAGKLERDQMTNKVAPAVADTEAKWKSSCGCPLKMTVDDTTLTTMEDLRAAQHFAENVAEGVVQYCTDASSRKAMCQMHTLAVTHTDKEETFSYKNGTGTCAIHMGESCAWDQITRAVDK